jgi:medium-chain acyl-[acyl-carrier-protein] hydrolase
MTSNQKHSISRWILSQPGHAGGGLRLFCFPYAGGSAAIFRDWKRFLPAEVDVCPIQLPGRADRIQEGLAHSVESIVSSLINEITPYLDRPFAFFGHSMGALVAFELARRLERGHLPAVSQLFVSGRNAPDIREPRRDYELPHRDFIAMLRKLNGTPREILDNQEALALLLPIIRADFRITQTYQFEPGAPLHCPIKAFGGIKDTCTPPESIRGWQRQTTGSFSLSILPGDHFFISESRTQVLAIVGHELCRLLDRESQQKTRYRMISHHA